MTADKRRMPSAQASARGGLRAAANMSPEARSERARIAGLANAAKQEAKRIAEGQPPRRVRPPQPSVVELEPWLAEVDRRYPDRQWKTGEERRREAVLLLRIAAAEAIEAAMKGRSE